MAQLGMVPVEVQHLEEEKVWVRVVAGPVGWVGGPKDRTGNKAEALLRQTRTRRQDRKGG